MGSINYPYIVEDNIANNDGKVYFTASTGNSGGKICSALDFTSNSTSDYAILDENFLKIEKIYKG